MIPTRFVATAVAAALIACPALAVAQPAATTPAPTTPPAAPAAPTTPALPSIPKVAGGANIYETLKAAGQFTILVKALDQTGLTPYLTQYPNFTFFAPTDAAFNALPPDVLSKLMAANDTAANQLQQILKYHLVTVSVGVNEIKGHHGDVKTAENTSVTVDGSNPDDLLVNNADIIQAGVHTNNNGIVNVIDKVLVPTDSPYASAVPQTPAATPAPTAPATPAGA